MILMIDNYDSFTFNLVQYFQQLGQDVVVKRNDEIDIAGVKALKPDHLVISPGPCTPNEAGVSLELVEKLAGQLPILGVCLGHQTIGQVFGAEVVRAHQVMHGKTSDIQHDQTGLFRGLPSPMQVTRYHSLLLKPDTVPDCFHINAWVENSETQEPEVMGIQHDSIPLFGVQFHPESILTEHGHDLLRNFLSASGC